MSGCVSSRADTYSYNNILKFDNFYLKTENYVIVAYKYKVKKLHAQHNFLKYGDIP